MEDTEVFTTADVLKEICDTTGDITVHSLYDTIHKIFPNKLTNRFTQEQVDKIKSYYQQL